FEVLGDELLRRQALLGGVHLDRRSVGITGAQKDDVPSARAQEAHVDVGLHVLHHVAEVERTVGIGKRAGDEQSFGHRYHLNRREAASESPQAASRRQMLHSSRSSTSLPLPDDLSATSASAHAASAAKSSPRS